jgi:hypothetical protein
MRAVCIALLLAVAVYAIQHHDNLHFACADETRAGGVCEGNPYNEGVSECLTQHESKINAHCLELHKQRVHCFQQTRLNPHCRHRPLACMYNELVPISDPCRNTKFFKGLKAIPKMKRTDGVE